MRIVLAVGLALPVLAAPGAQVPSARTPEEILSSAIADMRGRDEILDLSRTENNRNQGALWFSAPAGTVSAKRLRHSVPKAARKAYEKALRGRDPKSIADGLKLAIQIDPGFADAHNDLGVAYTRLGQYSQAEAEFRQAIALVPEESLPHSNLAWVLFTLGRRVEAESSGRRAIHLSPDNAAAHLLIGRVLLETGGAPSEGFSHLEYAARTMPQARELLKILGGK